MMKRRKGWESELLLLITRVWSKQLFLSLLLATALLRAGSRYRYGTAATDKVEDGDAQNQNAHRFSMRTDVAPMLERTIGKQIKAFACNNRHFAIAKNGIYGTGQLMHSGGFCDFISDVVTSDPDIEHLEDVWLKYLMDSMTSRVGAEAQQRRRSVWRESANNLTMKRGGLPETVSLFNYKSCCVAGAKHFCGWHTTQWTSAWTHAPELLQHRREVEGRMEGVKDTSSNSLRTRLGMEEGLRNLVIRFRRHAVHSYLVTFICGRIFSLMIVA